MRNRLGGDIPTRRSDVSSLTAAPLPLPSHRSAGVVVAAALHVAVVVAAVATALLLRPPRTFSLMPATVSTPAAESADTPPVVIAPGPALAAVEAIPADTASFETFDGFTFDTSKIRARRSVLFPFLTGRLPFLDELQGRRALEQQRLRNPFGGSGRRAGSRTPLVLTSAAFDALVDESWSRRDRWQGFSRIADLARRFDADEGQLPDLVRAHVERNLLQPYFDSAVHDPRFWVVLGLAADHVDVVEFVGRYAREHPSSRTTTELLFLLDELTDASADAFELLMQMDAASLTVTGLTSPENVQLAVQLQRGYREWARANRLDQPGAAAAQFARVRRAILATIVETSPGGYGAADARYLAGRILWDEGDTERAVRLWRGMGSDARTAYASVRADISRAILTGGRVDVVEITRALGAERGRWLRESTERLARFGYLPTTF